jgi:hypothetical protein
MASIDRVFAQANHSHTCAIAADRIGELLLGLADDAGVALRSGDPSIRGDPLSMDEYVEAGILTADQVAPVTADVYFVLRLQRRLSEAERLTFVFEGASDADLSGIAHLRLSIREQVWVVPVHLVSPHTIQAQVNILEQDVLDRRKRLVLRPIKIELISSDHSSPSPEELEE